MSKPYLTPEEVEQWAAVIERFACSDDQYAVTLRAYVKVVKAVAKAEVDGLSYAHGVTAYVIDEETVMLARKLRGHAES